MQGLSEILARVVKTGTPETIFFNDSKEATKVCRDIKNRIEFKREFWCLNYKRLSPTTVKISKEEADE